MAGAARTMPIGVVCDDRAQPRQSVGRLLVRSGFELGGSVEGFPALRKLVRALQPTVVVVTLPLPGMNGLRAVRDLHADASACQIVLVSEFGQLDIAAGEAGAVALVPEQDLKALQLVLLGIAEATATVVLPHARGQFEDTADTVAL